MKIWSPSDGSDEWLSRSDCSLAVALLRGIYGEDRPTLEACETVLEVGVWKGAWTSVILVNFPQVRVDGVDPYPGSASVRTEMEARLTNLGISDRFRLAVSLKELPPEVRYSMIHIDGEHSEQAVTEDLAFASEHLVSDGVIIADDYRHSWFPGITSALFRFLNAGEFKLFAVSGNKAYLARTPYADKYYCLLQDSFAGSISLPVWTHWRQWDGDKVGYVQSPDVYGQRVLLCGMSAPLAASRQRRLAKDWLPPVIVRTLLKAGRRMRRD